LLDDNEANVVDSTSLCRSAQKAPMVKCIRDSKVNYELNVKCPIINKILLMKKLVVDRIVLVMW
jgi:hypothetical protein